MAGELQLCFKKIPSERWFIFGVNKRSKNSSEITKQINLLASCVRNSSVKKQITKNKGYFKGTAGNPSNHIRNFLHADLQLCDDPVNHYNALDADAKNAIPVLGEKDFVKSLPDNNVVAVPETTSPPDPEPKQTRKQAHSHYLNDKTTPGNLLTD